MTFLEEFIGSDDIDSDVGKSDVESDIDSDVDEFDVESNLNPIDDDDLDVAGPSGQNGNENKKFLVNNQLTESTFSYLSYPLAKFLQTHREHQKPMEN